MSQDSYTPDQYAELMASMAADLDNDLLDGNLGRDTAAHAEMVEQLCMAGIKKFAAEGVVADFIRQLRTINECAEALRDACAKMPAITEAMTRSARNLHPGFEFDRYAV